MAGEVLASWSGVVLCYVVVKTTTEKTQRRDVVSLTGVGLAQITMHPNQMLLHLLSAIQIPLSISQCPFHASNYPL